MFLVEQAVGLPEGMHAWQFSRYGSRWFYLHGGVGVAVMMHGSVHGKRSLFVLDVNIRTSTYTIIAFYYLVCRGPLLVWWADWCAIVPPCVPHFDGVYVPETSINQSSL